MYFIVFSCIFPSISHLPAASSQQQQQHQVLPHDPQQPAVSRFFPENRDILFCFSLRFSHVFSVLFYCILACACVFHVFLIHVVVLYIHVFYCIFLHFPNISHLPAANSQQQQQHQVLPHDPQQPTVSMFFPEKPRHSFLF